LNEFSKILLAKGVRVLAFGFTSIMTPVYVSSLGYSPFYVGLALASIVGGNIFSNVLVTWFGNKIGIPRLLQIFSLLMLASGILLFATVYYPLIIAACFIGNISTTGTEAGPFQSVETGVLPNFVQSRAGRAFGVYNLVGYICSAVGALAASLPSYFQNSLLAFHYLYLAFGFVGVLLFVVYSDKSFASIISDSKSSKAREETEQLRLRGTVKEDVTKLSILNGVDAFGGGFVSQSILSYWFFLVYNVSLGNLGTIFFLVNIIIAISIFLAPLIAERLGNLRTMVLTHLVSNVFLIAIPFAGSLDLALVFLFLRQSMSQMDVPTRQTFMIEIFERQERVRANAVTNTARSVANIFGSPITGALLTMGLVSTPIISGGVSKIAYDVAIFLSYRKRTS
jgi:MFS family permease